MGWSGWYSGKYTDYKASTQAAMKESMDNAIESTLGNEAIVQINSTNYAQDGDWSEN